MARKPAAKPAGRLAVASSKAVNGKRSGVKAAPVKSKKAAPQTVARVGSTPAAVRRTAVGPRRVSAQRRSRSVRLRRVSYSPWKEPTYADSTDGDRIDGEDLEVRRAAVEALGPLNGTVVVVDAFSGRILTIVNQKVALRSGYTPCSTVKIFVGLAGLSEGIVERETPIRLTRRLALNLTDALARSDNTYFAKVGQELGFERVVYYARLLGLGEKATLGWDAEESGRLPSQTPPDGVGMMSSFGHGISLTPLQLAAALAALANGGTLYYLQYPLTRQEAENFVPRVKRHLEIQHLIPEITPGMMAAVESGTARRAGFDPDEPVLGKTGTCTDRATPTHLGWFGSFNEVEKNRLAVVVLLTGGKPINGPVASGVAGRIYRTLSEQGYFERDRAISPVALLGNRQCCVE